VSIAVSLEELPTVLGEYDYAFFLTVDDAGRSHAVSVRPYFSGELLAVTGIGQGTRRFAAERPAVALVWPAPAPSGPSLIVDAVTVADDGAAELLLRPVSAIRHRPA
jgi:hypothetical protein